MYLSRLILNPRSRQVRSEARSPYEMHRSLFRAFAQKDEGGPGRVLFRLDIARQTGRAVLLVQSEKKPDWTRLTAEHPDYCLEPADANVEENPAGPKDISKKLNFAKGQILSFRLRANPTKKEKVEGKKNGRRVGLITEDEQLAWLNRKGKQGGFCVLSASVVREDGPTELGKGFKDMHGRKAKLSLLSVRFDGALQVADPKQFRETVENGIGSGKAFGFGLLSLAPA